MDCCRVIASLFSDHNCARAFKLLPGYAHSVKRGAILLSKRYCSGSRNDMSLVNFVISRHQSRRTPEMVLINQSVQVL